MSRGPALALLAALAACDRPRTNACPGERVGTFQFQAVLDPSAPDCPGPAGAAPGSSFVATIAYGANGAVSFCVDRAEASPLTGTRAGDAVSVTAGAQAATVPACACPVQVVERVEGRVLRADAGAAGGFEGVLSADLAPTDGGAGGACEPDGGIPGDGGLTCGVPCTVRWRLTGTP